MDRRHELAGRVGPEPAAVRVASPDEFRIGPARCSPSARGTLCGMFSPAHNGVEG
jgi:hypothetical protein